MNDFGRDLTGLQAIYQALGRRPLPKEERTFICESGPGCQAVGGGLPGFLFGARTIKARYADGTSEFISSYSLAAIIVDGKEIQKPEDKSSETVEEIAYVVRLEGEPKVFIPVKSKPQPKESPTGRFAKAEPNLQNIPIRTELGAEIRKAFVGEPAQKAAVQSPTTSAGTSAPRTPRQDRDAIVNDPEFIALFEGARSRFKDPSRSHCKNGHPICAANAHVGDMRRPPHRYSCDPCLRKEPPAPGFSA